MNKIEPTYLRYVIDNLVKGTISAENAAGLPNGFVEIYEKELIKFERLSEREELFDQLLVWALLKESVSTNLVAGILKVEESLVKSLIDQLSNWFNSVGNGKYQLYHERIRMFILSKMNDNKIQKITESIITFCEQVLLNAEKFEEEFIDFTLKNYTVYLVNQSYFKHQYYKSLLEYCFSKEVRNIHLKRFKSIKYINISCDDAIRRAIELNKNDDIFQLINEKIKNNKYIISQLNNSYKYSLSEFTEIFLSSGLTRDKIYFQQYFLLALFKLFKLIRSNTIQQIDVDVVFTGINKIDYEDYFADISLIASDQFYSELILKLQGMDIDCLSIFHHLPDDFNIDVQRIEYEPSKFLSPSFADIQNNDITSFIKNKWESEAKSDNNADFFSSIDDPIYFQDKLIELYEFAVENGDIVTLINALGATKSKIHFSEILTLLIIHLDKLSDNHEAKLVENTFLSHFEINYFNVIERLKKLIDKLLINDDLTELTNILFNLDRNSFEYYLEYSFNHYCENRQFKKASEVIDILIKYIEENSLSKDSTLLSNLVDKFNRLMIIHSENTTTLILPYTQYQTTNYSENAKKFDFFQSINGCFSTNGLSAVLYSQFISVVKEDYEDNLVEKIERIFYSSQNELHQDLTESIDTILLQSVLPSVDFSCRKVFTNSGLESKLDELDTSCQIIIKDIERRWNGALNIEESDFLKYRRVHISLVDRLCNDIISLRNLTDYDDVDSIVDKQVIAMKESIPFEHYTTVLGELIDIFRVKVKTSIEIRNIRQNQLQSYFKDLVEQLHLKLELVSGRSDMVRLLLVTKYLNENDLMKEYFRQLLENSNIDVVLISYFTSIPSLATFIELLKEYSFKEYIYKFLEDNLFPEYNYLLFKNYYSEVINNPLDYLHNIGLLKESSLSDAYFNLGLQISENSIDQQIINSIERLYLKDFIRGYLFNIYNSNVDTFKYLKFLYYHTISLPDLSTVIKSELFIYSRLYQNSGLNRHRMLNRQIENIYTKKIFDYAQ